MKKFTDYQSGQVSAVAESRPLKADSAALESRYVPTQNAEFYTFAPEISPLQVRGLLYSAMQGNFYAAYDLFSMIQDQSPRVTVNLHETCETASKLKYRVQPAALPGQKPTGKATERRDFIDWALRQFAPEPGTDEVGLTGLKYDLLWSLRQPTLVELMYHVKDGLWCPRAGAWINPRKYAFDGESGRLGVAPLTDAGTDPRLSKANVTVIDPLKCLTAVYKTRSGSMTMSGLMRPLALWWPLATFGKKWLFRFAERFGTPFIHTKYASGTPPSDIQTLKQLAAGWGANGHAETLDTTAIEFVETHFDGKDNPQNWLIEKFDYYCDLMFLGEIRTSDISAASATGRGGHAQAKEMSTKQTARALAVGAFVNEGPLDQLVTNLLMLNYGDADEKPLIVPDDAVTIPETEKATRDATLKQAGWQRDQVEISEDYNMTLTPVATPAAVSDQPSAGSKNGNNGNGKSESQKLTAENSAEILAAAMILAEQALTVADTRAMTKLSETVRAELVAAKRQVNAHLAAEVERILAITDDNTMLGELRHLYETRGHILEQMNARPGIAPVLERATGTQLVNGMLAAQQEQAQPAGARK